MKKIAIMKVINSNESTKTEFATLRATAMEQVKELQNLVKGTAEYLLTMQDKKATMNKLQLMVDSAYVMTLAQSDDIIKAFVKDDSRPVVTCKWSQKDRTSAFSMNDEKVFTLSALHACLANIKAEREEAKRDIPENIAVALCRLENLDLETLRRITAAWAIRIGNREAGEEDEMKAAFLEAGYDTLDMEDTGRNATEKVWQNMVDTLLPTGNKKPAFRVKISMVNEFIIVDHVFDRLSTGMIQLVTCEKFEERIIHVLHEQYTNTLPAFKVEK